jgi:hypothetical protein
VLMHKRRGLVVDKDPWKGGLSHTPAGRQPKIPPKWRDDVMMMGVVGSGWLEQVTPAGGAGILKGRDDVMMMVVVGGQVTSAAVLGKPITALSGLFSEETRKSLSAIAGQGGDRALDAL